MYKSFLARIVCIYSDHITLKINLLIQNLFLFCFLSLPIYPAQIIPQIMTRLFHQISTIIIIIKSIYNVTSIKFLLLSNLFQSIFHHFNETVIKFLLKNLAFLFNFHFCKLHYLYEIWLFVTSEEIILPDTPPFMNF